MVAILGWRLPPDAPTRLTDEPYLTERVYVFTDGNSAMELACREFGDPPEDRWLSIAETFEFLPED